MQLCICQPLLLFSGETMGWDCYTFKHYGKEDNGCGKRVDLGVLSLIKKIGKHWEWQSDLIKQVSAVYFSPWRAFWILTSVAHLPVFSSFPWSLVKQLFSLGTTFCPPFSHSSISFFVLPSGLSFSAKLSTPGKDSPETDYFGKCF